MQIRMIKTHREDLSTSSYRTYHMDRVYDVEAGKALELFELGVAEYAHPGMTGAGLSPRDVANLKAASDQMEIQALEATAAADAEGEPAEADLSVEDTLAALTDDQLRAEAKALGLKVSKKNRDDLIAETAAALAAADEPAA